MCGIAGVVAEDAGVYKKEVRRMMDTLEYRGPDGEGTCFFRRCGLGHKRLSIIDLKTGDQPMFSHDGKIAIIFNGEIYGYRELKRDLPDYPFRTTSDTEVILALYEKYGEGFLEHLPGMFAFALWDEQEQKLICARDRFGEKPFYYAVGPRGEFIFASEIKAILASQLIKPILDKKSLAFYLKHVYVHPYHTIYKNVYVLPPAHVLLYKQGKITVSRYWKMPLLDYTITFDEAVDEFKRLFIQSVQRQMVADVPVGSFLSGGLDSSTTIAIASEYKRNFHTFSFAFRDSINELPFAREIAEKYNTNHTELFDDEGESLGELFLKMQDVYDEPSGDSSNIPTYLISKLSRQHTKVTMTGEGADELLGGYVAYRPFLHMKAKSDQSLRISFLRYVAKLAQWFNVSRDNILFQKALGALYTKELSSVGDIHLNRSKAFSESEVNTLGLDANPEKDLYTPSWETNDTLDDVMRIDLEGFLPGDVLVKSDRASMANSLELRAPFLDVDVASFCISLPYHLKITKDSDKRILREAFADTWTDSIRRRGKLGFGAPIHKWLSEDKSLRVLKEDYLKNPKRKVFNIIPYRQVQYMIKSNDYRTWAFLELALWMETHDF